MYGNIDRIVVVNSIKAKLLLKVERHFGGGSV
jgi:hypothetical protein